MAKVTPDSPLSRRIVLSFLRFLDSVEPPPGIDLEGLEVAKECLAEAFNIDLSCVDFQSNTDSLVDIFCEREATAQCETNPDQGKKELPANGPSASSSRNAGIADCVEQGEDQIREAQSVGTAKDELFGQLFDALEGIHYFRSMPDGKDDLTRLDKATNIFHNALEDMQKSGCKTFDRRNLAEGLKSLGNKAMQSKLYPDSIELYTFAIALCEDNAVYYCNRAAAYTQLHLYSEAVKDCLKSIEINPTYTKGYSRLGFAHYAQGRYRDAIDGFMKALQLDPNNDSIKENIRVAEQKLTEEQERGQHNQGSRNHDMPPPFTSMPFGAGGLPANLANMFMNMGTNPHHGQNAEDGPVGGDNAHANFPSGMRMDGNANLNFGEQMPEELTGALRSVMEMMSGAAPHGNPQENTNSRPAPS